MPSTLFRRTGPALVLALAVLLVGGLNQLPPADAVIDHEPCDYQCDHPGTWVAKGRYTAHSDRLHRHPEWDGRPLWSWECSHGCTPVDE